MSGIFGGLPCPVCLGSQKTECPVCRGRGRVKRVIGATVATMGCPSCDGIGWRPCGLCTEQPHATMKQEDREG